jgi:hypothetical protein
MPVDIPGDPPRDFARMLDLDRSTLIKDFVGEMEARMRDVETALSDLKDIAEAAARQEFTPREVAAMKKIAKLRLKDQKAAASLELEALQRIGRAAGFDVFDFGAVR